MNKSFAVAAAAFAVAVLAGPVAAGPGTFAEAQELATKQDKALLIDFFATW